MPNTIEFIIKATDKASDVVASIETKITTGTEKAAKSLDNLTQSSDKSQRGFGNLQAAIVTANQAIDLAGRGFGIVKQAIDQTVGATVTYAKEVRDLATNLGITAEETSKIIQASDDYGISVETVTGALQMAVKRGFAPNIETLARLADEYNKIQDPVQRAQRLTDVFGRGWTALTPMLKEGGQAIRDAAAEAEKLGLVLSDKDVQGARALEIQIDNLNDRVDALKLKIGKDLIPGLVIAAEDFTRLTDKVQGTEDPLTEAKIVLDRVTAAFGENSPATAHAREEYEKLKKAADALNLTDTEKRIRAATQAFYQSGEAQNYVTKAVGNSATSYNVLGDAIERAKTRAAIANGVTQETINMMRAHNAVIAESYNMAIQYTESQQEQGKVQAELDKLNATIEARGPKHVVTVKNEKLSTDELAKAQAQLAVAQEDLAGATIKEGETQAEFTLRVETLKGKVADYSQTLGEHTAVVGGATKAELEQKKALEEQIATLQKTDEIAKAKGAFEALTKAFQDGTLTEAQYTERATALNSVANLYTAEALKQATAQEVLMKSFADPSSEIWRGQLLKNQEALDGQVTKTNDLTAATDAAKQAMTKAGVPTTIEVKIKPTLDSADLKKAHDLAGDLKFAQAPLVTPKIDTTQAVKDFDAFYVGKVGAIPKEAKTTAVLDKTAASKDVINLTNLYNTLPKVKSTTVEVDAKLAQQQLDDILRTMSYITDKDVTITTHYRTTGDRPEGFQSGIDMIVPSSPTGRTGDYFPFLAAPGERVTVQTPAQQAARQAAPAQSGDTYNYVTNVYNPLAAAMLADKQRRDRLARSNARMGVV